MNELIQSNYYYPSLDNKKQLCKTCYYIDNKLHGEYKEYYINGQLYKICNYIDGKLHGEYKTYYQSNDIYESYNYIDGDMEKLIEG